MTSVTSEAVGGHRCCRLYGIDLHDLLGCRRPILANKDGVYGTTQFFIEAALYCKNSESFFFFPVGFE